MWLELHFVLQWARLAPEEEKETFTTYSFSK